LRADLYKFLSQARQPRGKQMEKFQPDKTIVTQVIDALAAVAQLDVSLRAPFWLDDPADESAGEILACSNGLLFLPTQASMEHTPKLFNLSALDYEFDPDAAEPRRWLRFLHDLWGGDQEAIDTLQEWFGLLLSSETRFQKMLLLIGPKRSGKSTIARMIAAVIGRDSITNPTLSGLGEPFGMQSLIDKPVAIIPDARMGRQADVAKVVESLLAISGEDSVEVRRMYRSKWSGRLPTRFSILSNEVPRFADASEAIASRFLVLTITVSFYGHEDLGLFDKLIPERPSILKWALAGLQRLKQRGYFIQPKSGREDRDTLYDLASPIGAFVDERCSIDAALAVSCADLFSSWQTWCKSNGRDHSGTAQGFSRDLHAAFPSVHTYQPKIEGRRPRWFSGIGLNEEEHKRLGRLARIVDATKRRQP